MSRKLSTPFKNVVWAWILRFQGAVRPGVGFTHGSFSVSPGFPAASLFRYLLSGICTCSPSQISLFVGLIQSFRFLSISAAR